MEKNTSERFLNENMDANIHTACCHYGDRKPLTCIPALVMSSTGAEKDSHTHTPARIHTHTWTLAANTRGPVEDKLVPLMCHKMPPKVINWSVIGGRPVIYMHLICIKAQRFFPSKAFCRFYTSKANLIKASAGCRWESPWRVNSAKPNIQRPPSQNGSLLF